MELRNRRAAWWILWLPDSSHVHRGTCRGRGRGGKSLMTFWNRHTHAYVAEALAGVRKACRSELSMFFIVIESPTAYGCLLCGAARCENAATGAVRVFLAVGLS